MRSRILLSLAVLLTVLSPASAQTREAWHVLDWLPGADIELHRQLAGFFRLDASRLPRLEALPGGGLALVNPGGAPTAVAWTAVTDLPPGVWTWRFDVRWAGEGEPAPASATFLTDGGPFHPTREWRSQGFTAVVPGPLGPGSAALSLRGREGRLEMRNSTRVRLPFSASARSEGERVRLELAGQVLEGIQVELRSMTLEQWASPGGETVCFPFIPDDRPGWVPGGEAPGSALLSPRPLARPYLVRWRLLDAQGQVLHGGGWLRVGETPEPPRASAGRDVRVDGSGVLQVEGRPFLPLGLYTHESSSAALDAVADLGLNLALMGETAESPELVRQARARGLEVILETTVPPEGDRVQAEVSGLVERLGGLPVLAWTAVDEPDLKPAYAPVLASIRRTLAKMDSRPLYQSNRSPASFPWAVGAADILAVDPYPLAAVPRPLSTVGRWVDQALEAAPPGRSVWYVNQAFAMAPLWNRPPSPEQLRAMNWIALIHGARGIVYYTLHDILDPQAADRRWELRRSPLWEEIRRQSTELRALEPWLLSPGGPERPRLGSPLESALWRLPEGDLLAVVNPTDRPLVGALSLPAGTREARTWPGGRAVALTSGSLAVELPAYGVSLFLVEPRR